MVPGWKGGIRYINSIMGRSMTLLGLKFGICGLWWVDALQDFGRDF